MRLARRNNGGLVICATHAELNQEVEAPFDVREVLDGYELWAWPDDGADEMELAAHCLSEGALLYEAAKRLPPQWKP